MVLHQTGKEVVRWEEEENSGYIWLVEFMTEFIKSIGSTNQLGRWFLNSTWPNPGLVSGARILNLLWPVGTCSAKFHGKIYWVSFCVTRNPLDFNHNKKKALKGTVHEVFYAHMSSFLKFKVLFPLLAFKKCCSLQWPPSSFLLFYYLKLLIDKFSWCFRF